MNRDEVDAFLAEADDVINDWEGSADSAAWSGDGSHETEISGDYYGNDQICECLRCTAVRWLSEPQAQEILEGWARTIEAQVNEIMAPAAVADLERPPSEVERFVLEAMGVPLTAWQSRILAAATDAEQPFRAGWVVGGRRAGRTSVSVRGPAGGWIVLDDIVRDAHAIRDQRRHTLGEWQAAVEPVEEPTTVVSDDRVERPRRRGRAAQDSPYGPGHRP